MLNCLIFLFVSFSLDEKKIVFLSYLGNVKLNFVTFGIDALHFTSFIHNILFRKYYIFLHLRLIYLTSELFFISFCNQLRFWYFHVLRLSSFRTSNGGERWMLIPRIEARSTGIHFKIWLLLWVVSTSSSSLKFYFCFSHKILMWAHEIKLFLGF